MAQVSQRGGVTIYTARASAAAAIDYSNAKPLALPMSRTMPQRPAAARAFQPGPAGSVEGAAGTGETRPIRVAPARTLAETLAETLADAVEPQDHGTANHVFTTARVNAQGDNSFRYYPYRAAGRLFFNTGSGSAWCTGSLIKPGVVVTAAHCVAEFGASRFYTSFQFIPAYQSGFAPYGAWTVAQARVLTPYFDGTDSCVVPGVVCADDVAVLVLNPQSGAYAGASTGYLGYTWGGWGFNPAVEALITQLGYPASLDSGEIMERTDSQSYNGAAGFSNNNIIGSAMTGGSSGGPWIVNFGVKPVGYANGSYAPRNKVVGVTSWGYISTAVKEQGASPFTTVNVVALVNGACTAFPAACQ